MSTYQWLFLYISGKMYIGLPFGEGVWRIVGIYFQVILRVGI